MFRLCIEYSLTMNRLIISVSSTTNRLVFSYHRDHLATITDVTVRYIHKKAGLRCCCSAQRGSGKPYILNKQHCNPRYMCMYAQCAYGNTHREHLRVAMFWNICEIYQISLSQNKARKTLFCHYVIPFYVSDPTLRFFTLSVPAVLLF